MWIRLQLPPCTLNRWQQTYKLHLVRIDEGVPETMSIAECNLFNRYLFVQLLELYDVKWFPQQQENGCPILHTMPRFIHIDDGS